MYNLRGFTQKVNHLREVFLRLIVSALNLVSYATKKLCVKLLFLGVCQGFNVFLGKKRFEYVANPQSQRVICRSDYLTPLTPLRFTRGRSLRSDYTHTLISQLLTSFFLFHVEQTAEKLTLDYSIKAMISIGAWPKRV